MSKEENITEKDSQTLLNQLIIDYMKDQRGKRRWRWVLRIIILVIIIFMAIKLSRTSIDDAMGTTSKPHAGLIDLKGTVFEEKSFSADNFAKSLESAYENENMKGLIIRINSPGGSPVQADYMFNLIRQYEKKKPDVKIYAVCVDSCLSAAYYVASAADEIYANPSSLVGSIGVVSSNFGFVDTIQKLGITRRLVTAGENKGFLDPFSPEKPADKTHLQSMLDQIHQQFINKVKEGRGNRLKVNDKLFSGLFWTGEEAIKYGLIDGFGSSGDVLRDKIKLDSFVDYTYSPNLFEKFTKNLGTALADELPEALGIKKGISASGPIS